MVTLRIRSLHLLLLRVRLNQVQFLAASHHFGPSSREYHEFNFSWSKHHWLYPRISSWLVHFVYQRVDSAGYAVPPINWNALPHTCR